MLLNLLLMTWGAWVAILPAGNYPNPSEVIAKIAQAQADSEAAFEREIISWQTDYEVKSFGPGEELRRHAKYTQRYNPAGFALSTENVVIDKSSRGGGKDLATAKNRNYSFSLSRTPGSSGWVLNKADRLDTGVPATAANQPHRFAGTWFARHLYTADGRLYANVLRDNRFHVTACSTSPANPDWVRVAGELPAEGKKPAVKGWWDFDTTMGYCCRGSESVSNYNGYSTVDRDGFSLSLHDSGLITLDRHEFTGHADYMGQIKNQEHGAWTFKYRRDPDVAESEFTLSAFGLPEPYFVTPSQSHTWLYLLAAAGVLFVGAWLLWRRYWHRQAVA